MKWKCCVVLPQFKRVCNDPAGQSNGQSEGSPTRRKSEKTTRVRTVLNEKQLHTLRTCYAANPRPDAMMKEQLVEMTGLSPRVIRVWFQNKRCKDKKKSMMLNKPSHHQGPGSDDGQVERIFSNVFLILGELTRSRFLAHGCRVTKHAWVIERRWGGYTDAFTIL